jgi:hypothetical protein
VLLFGSQSQKGLKLLLYHSVCVCVCVCAEPASGLNEQEGWLKVWNSRAFYDLNYYQESIIYYIQKGR